MQRPKFPEPTRIAEPPVKAGDTPTMRPVIFCACPDCKCDSPVAYQGDICKWCQRGVHQENKP